jgi:hypothetical protein
MNKNSIISSHTRKLLQAGVFDCLPDEFISRVHHLLLYPELSEKEYSVIIHCWRKGNYCLGFSTMQLLQETNQILSRLGMPLIEEDFLEFIID